MGRWLVLALATAGLVLAGLLGLSVWQQRWLATPVAALEAPQQFTIPAGASLKEVGRRLAEAGLLEHAWVWVQHGRRLDATTSIKAGEYQLLPGSTPAGLLEQFVSGRVLMYSLTLPEGWTFRQALAAAQAHEAIVAEFSGLADEDIMARLGLASRHPEGLFFPDTYRFQRGTTDREILDQALRRLQEELDTAWSRRRPGLPLDSPYEALILASVVEKETGNPDERARIAGVFINRLRLGMRLQTDPTVIYGLGKSFDGNLRRGDLRRDTPYNTYTRAGLPPTPIALVGREALEAAVQPEDTEFLYFVATGLGDGRHLFATTLAQHNANVSRHLANLRGGSGVQVR